MLNTVFGPLCDQCVTAASVASPEPKQLPWLVLQTYELRHTETHCFFQELLQNWEEHTAVSISKKKTLSCCKHQMLVVTVYNIKMPLGFLPSEFKIMSVKLLIRSYNYRAKEKSNHNLHSWNLSSTTTQRINWGSLPASIHIWRLCVPSLSIDR